MRMMLREYKEFRVTYFGLRISDFGISIRQSAIRNLQSGMTLIEVILVLLIVAILGAVVIPRVDFATSSKASVDGAAYMIASDIRYAQECAMANRISKTVTFSTATPNVYTFSPTGNLDSSGRLPSGVVIGSNLIVTFNSLGEPIAGGGGSVIVSGSGQSRTISVVNYTGKVNIS